MVAPGHGFSVSCRKLSGQGRAMIPVFRPPYGAWDKTVIEAARDAGFPTVLLWDVDSHDWGSPSPSAVLRAASRDHDGSIVVMHCGPSVTPTVLEAVINAYQKRGFGFVTVPQLLSGKVPATAFPAPAPALPPPAPVVDPEAEPISLMLIALVHRWTDWAI